MPQSLVKSMMGGTVHPLPEIKQQADQWQAKVDTLPIVLQTGPTRTLIDRFETAGLKPQAEKLRLSLELNSVVPTLK